MLKIFRKSKNDNIYIYSYNKPFKGETTKIIINKKKFLKKQDEDDDYWDFIFSKINKLSEDWKNLMTYIQKYKFDFCKKIKIFARNRKDYLKVELHKADSCLIFSNPIYQPIDLKSLRENKKLYKKFENRFLYSRNYDNPKTNLYDKYVYADIWFQWFSKNYPEFHLPMRERRRNDIILGACCIKEDLSEEPKIF